jgi:hypothetical protein
MNKIVITALVVLLALTGFNTFSVLTQKSPVLGGSTSGDWNVGGNLAVTGTSALTGATSFTSTLTASTFTQGGGVTSTSTSGAVVPLLASNFDTENVIDVTLNVQDATLSFPATTTLTSFIPVSGQTRTLFIRNATTTATMDITITGGTGVLLKNASSSPSAAIIYGDTDGANYGRITLIRKANTDIEALLDQYKD